MFPHYLCVFVLLCCISWTTKIHLPLRSGSHLTRNLFHDVHPSLLLFLHRLRSITIYNQVTLALACTNPQKKKQHIFVLPCTPQPKQIRDTNLFPNLTCFPICLPAE